MGPNLNIKNKSVKFIEEHSRDSHYLGNVLFVTGALSSLDVTQKEQEK